MDSICFYLRQLVGLKISCIGPSSWEGKQETEQSQLQKFPVYIQYIDDTEILTIYLGYRYYRNSQYILRLQKTCFLILILYLKNLTNACLRSSIFSNFIHKTPGSFIQIKGSSMRTLFGGMLMYFQVVSNIHLKVAFINAEMENWW